MKKYTILLIALTLSNFLVGQFYNEGATITIESGATLFVSSDLENNSGIIQNSGTIEVQAHLTNAATLTSNSGSRVIFSGTSNSNLTSGGAILENLQLNKASADVLLLDDAEVNTQLDFAANDNHVILSSNNMTIGTTGTINAYSSSRYLITGSTGELIKKSLSGFIFPLGFDDLSYNPVELTESGTNDDKGVRVLEFAFDDGTSAGNQLSNQVVDASWIVTESVVGGSDLEVHPHWSATDHSANFDLSSCGVSRHDGTAYDLLLSELGAANGSDPYDINKTGFDEVGTFIVGRTDALDYVTVSPRVILGGPYNGTDMNDDLRVATLIPANEPYTGLAGFTHFGLGGGEGVTSTADFDQTGTDDDIVDWVFLELRDKNNNTSVISTQSALLQRDGDIVNTDMTDVKFPGFGPEDYYVVVRHRNHLGVMTDAVQSLDRPSTMLDYTDGSTATNGSNAQQNISGVDVMWSGNAFVDNSVKLQGTNNDAVEIKNDILGHPSNFFNLLTFTYSDYVSTDTNMDGDIKFQGSNNDALLIKNNVLSHPSNFFNLLTFVIQQQLP